MKHEVQTPFQLSKNMDDYNPAIDQKLEDVAADFKYGATSSHVPTGVAMIKFSELLEALDWHVSATKTISYDDARQQIKDAAELMDKKFDFVYERLPR